MPPRLTVALLGLPGAGKSTLCRRLAARLGWDCFMLGDALRARALTDPELAEKLARGELAPESVAIDLIRGAVARWQGQVLILDGFPRHTEQLQCARELFSPLIGLLLDVPVELATHRLSSRRRCASCGWGGSLQHGLQQRCANCGESDLRSRPEDAPAVLPWRLTEAQQRLETMLHQWGGWPLVRIDGGGDDDVVLQHAERRIREHAIAGV